MSSKKTATIACLSGMFVACAFASGCGSTDGDDSSGDTIPQDPTIELGTVTENTVPTFQSLADNDSIFVIRGPQGGYHILGSIRVTDIHPGNTSDLFDPSNPTTVFMVEDPTTRIDNGTADYTQGIAASASPRTYEMLGRQIILNRDDTDTDGVELVLSVSFDDADGNQLTDRRTLIGLPHPLN